MSPEEREKKRLWMMELNRRRKAKMVKAEVTDVDANDAYIRTDKGTCRPDDVLKWPWELEQKGEQQ